MGRLPRMSYINFNAKLAQKADISVVCFLTTRPHSFGIVVNELISIVLNFAWYG